MKLKGLAQRLYNITFHTHTVSGIVISFALYVIFFAGAVTLFKGEFYQWENPAARRIVQPKIDYDAILTAVKKREPKFNLSDDISIRAYTTLEPHVLVYGHLIVPKGKPEIHYHTAYYPQTSTFEDEEKTTIGETLYRLHFFDQIPILGRYLSGFVALFFAFAVITGVMIHWQNIFTKFSGFSLKGSWKQLWTNSHTVFGLLGLPFQLMYAITGAYYMLSFLVLLPVVIVFFNGDQEKALKAIIPSFAMEVSSDAPIAKHTVKLSTILAEQQRKHPEQKLYYMQIKNFDREDGVVSVSTRDMKVFAGDGTVTVRMKDGKIIRDLMPGNKGYAESVLPGIARLHFATFGGLALKTIYFFMALFTCFVIISGVLLWKEARNKKSYTDKQRKFHHRVTMVYLAICFGLFPAVATLFAAELIVPNLPDRVFWVRTVFFVSWLILTVAGLFYRSEAAQTRFYLLTGGILSLSVPIVNGLYTGDWIWTALSDGLVYVAATDLSWLATGICSLAASMIVNRTRNLSEQPEPPAKGSSRNVSASVAVAK